MLEASVGSLTLRGIIDRLELDDDGGLVVTDYKTGAVPRVSLRAEPARRRPLLRLPVRAGARPAAGAIQLLYLSRAGGHRGRAVRPVDPRASSSAPSAIWTAVERACEREDFRPRPSRLCDWCSFQAYCPAFGGDPAGTARPSSSARRLSSSAPADASARRPSYRRP